MARPQPRYKPGDKIGRRYQVHDVKMGGMGEVYLCTSLKELHPFILKTFQQRYRPETLLNAFKQEVATWVALGKHPNIVRCYGLETLDNQPFMVLEWIIGKKDKGTDLRDWLRYGPLNLRVALDITIDITRGLLHAQTKQPGLVHRDLKPDNILMTHNGLAKVTDFGLAQIVEEAGLELETKEQHGIVLNRGIGTPAYMAPEQWRGEILDERTDIYAVGCILYELLTGTCPYQVDFVPIAPFQAQKWMSDMQSQHESGNMPDLPAHLPLELDNLLKQCMSKSRLDRPTNLGRLRNQLILLYQQLFEATPKETPIVEEMTVSDYYNRGCTYSELKRYDLALADFNLVIQRESDKAKAYSARGLVYQELKQYETALADLNQAIKLNPDDCIAYLNRGLTYAEMRQYDLALTDYDRAIKLNPTFVLAYSNRGNVLHELERFDEAMHSFNKAIDLDPTHLLTYYNRGTAYQDLHQDQLALADFNRAIEISPYSAEAYHNRAVHYHAEGEYQLALADTERAIALNPTLIESYNNRGSIYNALGEYDKALINYDYALKLDPDLAEAYNNRGCTYADLEKPKEAFADFDRAIELNPTYAEAYFNRGTVYQDFEQYEKAIVEFSRAIELNPNYAEALGNRGNAYRHVENYEQALSDFNKAINLDPDLSKPYHSRGSLYADIFGQYQPALADFNQAIELDPSYGESYNSRGAVHMHLGNFDAALADYDQAVKLDPTDAKVYYNIGVAFTKVGQYSESLSFFEEAAKLGLPQAKEAIAQIRPILNNPALSKINQARQAFSEFPNVTSLAAMRETVNRFPVMLEAEFLNLIGETIGQLLPEEQAYFEQRFTWLKEIVKEQEQKKQSGLFGRLFVKD